EESYNVYLSKVRISPDGATLLVRGSDQRVYLWDIKTDRVLRSWDAVSAAAFAFAPDGKSTVLAHGNDVVIYNVSTGKEQKRFSGHRGSVSALVFSPDGKAVVSASRDGTARIWDVAKEREFRCVAFHDGRDDGDIKQRGAQTQQIPLLSSDGSTLVFLDKFH